MAFSIYDATVPLYRQQLGALSAILHKAAAHADARKFDQAALVGDRLYPDMFPFARQIQIATDSAKGAVARLAGIEAPRYEDNETNLAQLAERIDRTLAYIDSVDRAQIDGSEDKAIVVKTPRGDLHFTGATFVQRWALPNFYFHCSTAYAILRHRGVELGKADFLGNIMG